MNRFLDFCCQWACRVGIKFSDCALIGLAVRRTGLTGLDWTGLDWTGLDWTGLDWTGPDRTGPDRTGPDRTGRDGTGRDGTGRDGTGRDGTGRDGTGRDGTGRDGTGRDGTGRDGTGRDGTGRDGTGRDGTGRDGTGRDGTGRDGTGRDGTGRDGTGRDGTGRDGTGRDGTGRDGTGRDGTGLDWTGLDWTGLDWTGLDWTDWLTCLFKEWLTNGKGPYLQKTSKNALSFAQLVIILFYSIMFEAKHCYFLHRQLRMCSRLSVGSSLLSATSVMNWVAKSNEQSGDHISSMIPCGKIPVFCWILVQASLVHVFPLFFFALFDRIVHWQFY